SMLAVFKSFGHGIGQLNGTNVYSLSMTIQSDVHEWFARLGIRFENIGRINLIPSQTITHSPYLPFLRDTSRPAPKVAHVLGAAEYINKQDRVVEDLEVRRKC
ncbi:hypothetical protein EDD85DRAFT_769268, partial [Armillaria nabsnona]